MTRPPLFIALRREWFERFRDGDKRVEWRRYGPRWNERTIGPDRNVVLSLGYSGARLRGTVTAVRRVAIEDAPAEARAIYASAHYLCAIHIVLDSD